MAAKKIPYGKTDFVSIMTENYYYVDKTAYIEKIEASSDFLFLIRPRRFGKSLWINTMSAYYDINYKDRFNEIFGTLYIGQHPTEERNQYLILKFNFSKVNPDDPAKSFESHCDTQFRLFAKQYRHLFDFDLEEYLSKKLDAAAKLSELSSLVALQGLSIYLFIDEYDNFANTILSKPGDGQQRYQELTHGAGFFRYFFNVIKGATTDNNAGIKKIFITGVSPITLDDVTSGFNIGDNITISKKFNSVIGFTVSEIEEMFDYYRSEGMIKVDTTEAMATMKKWYDNYCFAEECLHEKVFNTDMALYFMKTFIEENNPPKILVDTNIRTDYGKLRHLIILDKKLNGNFSKIREIAENGEVAAMINTSFPAEGLLKTDNFVSLLFYFGILSIDRVERGMTILKVPNQTTQKMLLSYIVDSYNDTGIFRLDVDRLNRLMNNMAYDGAWREFFEYMAEQVATQLSIRDFLEGEKAIQTLHLAYMYLLNYYTVATERERNHGYADLVLEPNLIHFPDMQFQYVIEFKYIPRKEKSETENFDKILETKRLEAINQLKKYGENPDLLPNLYQSKNAVELKLVYVIYHGWEMVNCGLVEY